MDNRQRTAALVDGLLKFVLVGGVISATMLAPNALVALDKPLQKILKKLDVRQQERELKRVLHYMKLKQLITTADYAHGINITAKGKKRAEKAIFADLRIFPPKQWDRHWRIVFFDIPESRRYARVELTRKLRSLGFQQLQRSTWVHPFPCRQEIEVVATTIKVQRYLSYIETSYIDNQQALRKAFSGLLKN